MPISLNKGGSIVVVKPNGDIVAVCKNDNDTVSGSSMIQQAVANGRKKSDSYVGNHKFYCKNGFEPICWYEFNEEYARTTGRKNTNKNIYYFINTLIKNIQIIVFLKMFDTLKDILKK